MNAHLAAPVPLSFKVRTDQTAFDGKLSCRIATDSAGSPVRGSINFASSIRPWWLQRPDEDPQTLAGAGNRSTACRILISARGCCRFS